MNSRSRENGCGVWMVKVGSIEHKIVAQSAQEAERWFSFTTGLGSDEYGEIIEATDLDTPMVFDTTEPIGVDNKGRPRYPSLTAREAIRRQSRVPGFLGT